jgi:hypothetical protein
MKVKCPCCGYEEDVPEEYIGETGICDACGHEFIVGQMGGGLQQSAGVAIVHLSMSNFHNGSASIKCPLCGEDNILPIAAANRSVRCGACDGKFYTEVRYPAKKVNINVHKKQVSDKHKRVPIFLGIIACIVYAVVFTPLSNKMLGLLDSVVPNSIKEKLQQRQQDELYEKLLMWYDAQLEYNGLKEAYLINGKNGDGVLMFSDGTSIQKTRTQLWYSKNIPKGFAQELIEARLLISNYERAHNYQKTRVKNTMDCSVSKRP